MTTKDKLNVVSGDVILVRASVKAVDDTRLLLQFGPTDTVWVEKENLDFQIDPESPLREGHLVVVKVRAMSMQPLRIEKIMTIEDRQYAVVIPVNVIGQRLPEIHELKHLERHVPQVATARSQ